MTADPNVVELLAPVDGEVTTATGKILPVTRAINTVGSVLDDAVIVPDGEAAVDTLVNDGYAVHFVADDHKHANHSVYSAAARSSSAPPDYP
jgi:catalase